MLVLVGVVDGRDELEVVLGGVVGGRDGLVVGPEPPRPGDVGGVVEVADAVAEVDIDEEVETVGVVEVVGVPTEQTGRVIVLESRLTCPLRASTLPATVVPVCTVADVRARTLPTNVVRVPRVALLPTCQNTLQGWAAPIRWTVLSEAVFSVDPA